MAGIDGTDLDDHYFCCFEAASIASLAALIEAKASVLDNGPSGFGNVLGLKYRLSDIKMLKIAFVLQRRNHVSTNSITLLIARINF